MIFFSLQRNHKLLTKIIYIKTSDKNVEQKKIKQE